MKNIRKTKIERCRRLKSNKNLANALKNHIKPYEKHKKTKHRAGPTIKIKQKSRKSIEKPYKSIWKT